MRETDSIREESTEDGSKRVAHIKPRYSLSLFFFLIPHGNDQNEDWCDATFEDAKEGSTYGEARKGCTCGMTAEDEAPEHDVDAEIHTKSRDVLRKILSRELGGKETCRN